ncbi:MAG: helix-turn-helix transcriptional regulator [Lachnospiraceae bacterium]|nr:helix-turn-helix transcriptional regulator [Lachnospiraceae bacterium]
MKHKLARELTSHRSVFTRILWSLLILLVVMLFFITFWINRIATVNQQRQVMESDLNRVTALNRTVEQIFDDLSQSMTQILWSSDFTSYMVAGASDDPQTQIYRMIRQLNSSARGTVVERAMFYAVVDGSVMENGSYSVKDISEWDEAYILDSVSSGENSILFAESVTDSVCTYLVTADGNIFLVQYFSLTSEPIGILIYEVDQEALNSALSNEFDEVEDIVFLYDAMGEPVLTDCLPYGEVEVDWDSGTEFLTQEEVREENIRTDGNYYYVVSERLGWQYILQINYEAMQVTLADTLRALVPALLIVLAFSVLITIYVVRSIYQPINRLVNLAAGKAVPAIDSKKTYNEFDLLEGAYSKALDQQEYLSAIVSSVAPEILESTILKLLGGKDYTMERMEEMLAGIGNPLPLTGRFAVGLCFIEEPGNRGVSDTEWNLYLASLQNMLSELASKATGFQFYWYRLDRVSMALILAFPEETSAVEVKREFLSVQQTLRRSAQGLPYTLYVESGQICNRLIDIRGPYLEAAEKVHYQRYSSRSEESVEQPETVGEEKTPEAETKIVLNRYWFKERSRSISALAARGERPGAKLMVEQVMAEVFQQYGDDLEGSKVCLEMFMDEMLEKLISYPLTQEEQEKLEESRTSAAIRGFQDEESLESFILEQCQEICRLILNYNKKNRYRYVETAKEFIGENYANSNLSLNDVAEHIGISASYLSELFNEISGEKFSAYLASYRVDKARQMLKVTSMTIKEIGFQCGFNSIQNFIRVFKKVTGYTPGQYRGQTE